MSNDIADQHDNSLRLCSGIERRDFLMGSAALMAAATVVPGELIAQTPKAPAAPPTPGFNNKIPDKILTPDVVQTRIGTLNFVDGVPTADTTRMVYDNLDFLRGVEVFLNFIPAASVESMRLGNAEMGATRSNQAVIMDQLLDSNPLFLTGNTDTVYCSVMLDLQTDGPTVVEVPAGSGPGTVNDAFFRFVVDMGSPGPDQGKGGKYLIVPADYKEQVPTDKRDGGEYFVARSPSYSNWLILRGFLEDGKPDAASRMFREGLKVYPLSQANNPPSSLAAPRFPTTLSTPTISSSIWSWTTSSKRSLWTS